MKYSLVFVLCWFGVGVAVVVMVGVCLTFISICSPGCPGTHHVDQAGLELSHTQLPLPPKYGD